MLKEKELGREVSFLMDSILSSFPVSFIVPKVLAVNPKFLNPNFSSMCWCGVWVGMLADD